MTRPICFIDTETTHLDRDIRRAWEIGIIRRDPDGIETERTWFVHTDDLDLAHADPAALHIGRFRERHPAFNHDKAWPERDAAVEIQELTRGATLAGAVTSFDEHTLDRMLRRHDLTRAWHHRLVDVRVYAAGVAGADPGWAFPEALAAFGLAEDAASRHTALGDARLARDLYDAARRRAASRGRPGDRVEDGGLMGTLVRCPECGGSGLLHKPDHLPESAEPKTELDA